MARRGLSTQALTGAIVVVIGVLLLLGTTGAYDVGDLWRYVPSLFVLLGVWALFRSGVRNVAGPVTLIVVAGTIQLLALEIITADVVVMWWPLLVVLFGLSLLFGRWRHRQRAPDVSTADFDLVGVFGGTERRVTSSSFSGGTATAIFGGVEVDLRDAAVPDPPAVITGTALFGGIEVTVPEEWVVEVDAIPVFGGVADDRPRRPRDAETKDEPDLLVTGFVAFGGITIT